MIDANKAERLRDFCHIDVDTDTRLTMAALRADYYRLASTVFDWLPQSRKKSQALTALEDSLAHAIRCLEVSMPGSVCVPPTGEDS